MAEEAERDESVPVSAERFAAIFDELASVSRFVSAATNGSDAGPRQTVLSIRHQLEALKAELGPDILQRLPPGSPQDAEVMLGVQHGHVLVRISGGNSWAAVLPETARAIAKGLDAAALRAESE